MPPSTKLAICAESALLGRLIHATTTWLFDGLCRPGVVLRSGDLEAVPRASIANAGLILDTMLSAACLKVSAVSRPSSIARASFTVALNDHLKTLNTGWHDALLPVIGKQRSVPWPTRS